MVMSNYEDVSDLQKRNCENYSILSHSSDSVVFQNGPGAILTGFVASMRMIVNRGQGRIMPIEILNHINI